MYVSYDDIISRIDEEPSWWTNGVPRYGNFSPSAVGVYGVCVVLVHTDTNCGMNYKVAQMYQDAESIKESIVIGRLDIGDPPNYKCGSPFESCNEIRILEFWERGNTSDWIRNQQYERPLIGHFERSPPKPIELTESQLELAKAAYQSGGMRALQLFVIESTGTDPFSAQEFSISQNWIA